MAEFVCEIDEHFRSACEGLEFYAEHEGKRYCVLHLPGEEKEDDFKKALESKLAQKDYDFGGTIFPEGTSTFHEAKFDTTVNFAGTTFIGEADFSRAWFDGERTIFTGARFLGNAYFYEALFSGEVTDFSRAWFDDERTIFSGEITLFKRAAFRAKSIIFGGAQFSGRVTDFSEAEFSGNSIDFSDAEFLGEVTNFASVIFADEVDFSESAFSTFFAYFREATFRRGARFAGPDTFDSRATVSFVDARIDEPELFLFDRVVLRPSWFIGLEVLEFRFTNVRWYGLLDRSEGGLDEEIEHLQSSGISSPHLLLARTCRELSTKAHENHEDPIASEFNYWANDALRKESWIRHRLPLRLNSYWLLNGYGERPLRAVVVLTLIVVAFAFVYMLVGPPELRAVPAADFWHHIEGFWHSLVYSLSVVSRLSPAPEPHGPNFSSSL